MNLAWLGGKVSLCSLKSPQHSFFQWLWAAIKVVCCDGLSAVNVQKSARRVLRRSKVREGSQEEHWDANDAFVWPIEFECRTEPMKEGCPELADWTEKANKINKVKMNLLLTSDQSISWKGLDWQIISLGDIEGIRLLRGYLGVWRYFLRCPGNICSRTWWRVSLVLNSLAGCGR